LILEHSIEKIISFTYLSLSSVSYSGEIFLLLNGAMGLILVKPSGEEFASYLTGLIEGDGSIIVPDSKTKSYRPFFEIVFHIEWRSPLQLA